jgi:TPR repeat protein
MPVDYCVCVLPLLIIIATIVAVVGGRRLKPARLVAAGLFALFLLIYFVPGWVLWVFAQGGDREAQFRLGNYYWTRLGYNWPDIEARDKWWVEAAEQRHPHAMYQVGYFSMFGSSKYIPKDLVASRKWLEAARAAGDSDAVDALQSLAEEEDKARNKKE